MSNNRQNAVISDQIRSVLYVFARGRMSYLYCALALFAKVKYITDSGEKVLTEWQNSLYTKQRYDTLYQRIKFETHTLNIDTFLEVVHHNISTSASGFPVKPVDNQVLKEVR